MVFSEVVNFPSCRKPVVNIHLDKHNNSGQPGRRILERTPQQCQPTHLVVLVFVLSLVRKVTDTATHSPHPLPRLTSVQLSRGCISFANQKRKRKQTKNLPAKQTRF